MAGGTFHLDHVKHVVDTVAGNAQFPLADAAALEAALGGADASVALGDEHHRASEVHQIPADFFPVESEQDLFTKLAFLRSANGDQAAGMQPAQRVDPPAGRDLPQPPQLPGRQSPGRNVPGVRIAPR